MFIYCSAFKVRGDGELLVNFSWPALGLRELNLDRDRGEGTVRKKNLPRARKEGEWDESREGGKKKSELITPRGPHPFPSEEEVLLVVITQERH